MFSKLPEPVARTIQYLLVLALLALTALCLMPPEWLPTALKGGFQPKSGLTFQGSPFTASQQADPSFTGWLWRIVTLVPLFLMVFGHEAWRRICPISGWMQIPRRLGTQLRLRVFNRRTGKIDHPLVMVDPQSWLARNAWYPPFAVLFIGVALRMTVFNSDAFMLGVFLVALLAAALLTGWLTGGKTWCHYFCPLSTVQRIYSEPGGLLESRAHFERKEVKKSTCRTLNGNSACVGCKANCPDIDLEKHYWEDLMNPSRRHVYFGYFGLVVGFFLFYRLYAGNWEFLLKGGWAVEDMSQACLNPGFFDLGDLSLLPKVIAAPLTLAVAVFASIAAWTLLENTILTLSNRIGKKPRPERVRHEIFVFVTFLTILIFYGFGIEMNLGDYPTLKTSSHVGLVFIATLWMFVSVQRSQRLYQREAVSQSLQRQLRNYSDEIRSVLGDTPVEELSPDETFVLARTLPRFQAQARFEIYRGVLREAIDNGQLSSAASLRTLGDLRKQLDLSEADHARILESLGLSSADLSEPGEALSREQRLRINSYRQGLESILTVWARANHRPIQEGLDHADVAAAAENLKLNFNIDTEEHERVLQELLNAGTGAHSECQQLLTQLFRHALNAHTLERLRGRNPYVDSVRRGISSRLANSSSEIVRNMPALQRVKDRKALCQSVLSLAGSDATTDPQSLKVIEETLTLKDDDPAPVSSGLTRSFRDFASAETSPTNLLEDLSHDPDPTLAAQALAALSIESNTSAIERSRTILKSAEADEVPSRLVLAARYLLGEAPPDLNDRLTVTATTNSETLKQQHFAESSITIGSGSIADFRCAHPHLFSRHLRLFREDGQLTAEVIAELHGVQHNKQPLAASDFILESGDTISIGPEHSRLTLQFHFQQSSGRGWFTEPMAHIDRLRYLVQFEFLGAVPLESLADLADGICARIYQKGAFLCEEGESTSDIIAICNGSADVTVATPSGEFRLLGTVGNGDVIGELACLTGGARSASICVTSSQCLALVIPTATIQELVRSDINATASLLKTVSIRLQSLLQSQHAS